MASDNLQHEWFHIDNKHNKARYNNVLTFLPYVVNIREDKGLFHIKATSYDIFGIFIGQSVSFLTLQVLQEKLFIICKLDNQGNIESILQISEWRWKVVILRQIIYYKITQIVRALWLAERRVYMRVCKHGCDVKMFCFSRANHASTNLRKISNWKISRQVYFIYPFLRRLKLGKSLDRCCVNFFHLSWHFKREKLVFWKAPFLQNKDWLRVQASCIRPFCKPSTSSRIA